jgi:hypothetical protein
MGFHLPREEMIMWPLLWGFDLRGPLPNRHEWQQARTVLERGDRFPPPPKVIYTKTNKRFKRCRRKQAR